MMIINVDGVWPGENMHVDLTKESGDFILPAKVEIYLDFMEFTGMGQWLTMIF